jgi:hypothetical protein
MSLRTSTPDAGVKDIRPRKLFKMLWSHWLPASHGQTWPLDFGPHGRTFVLHFMHYNFARIHMASRVTPVMEARISDHVWSLDEIVNLLDFKP